MKPNLDEINFGDFERYLLEMFSEKLAPAEDADGPPFPQYADDPVGFAHDALGIECLTDRQVEILESVRDRRETNVMAAHGVGKTFVAAIAVLWWVFSVGGLCPTTAPSQRFVNDLLWRNIRRMFDRKKDRLGGDRSQLRMWCQRDTSEAWGFAASPHTEEGFSGIHEKLLFAVQDEASGIAENIDAGYRSCLTGSDNRGLRIGNPLAPGTPFHYACERGAGKTIRITAFDHPNTEWAYGPDYKLKPEVAALIKDDKGNIKDRDLWPNNFQKVDPYEGGVSIEWIEDTRRRYGEQSSRWIARVMARFPDESPQSLVPRAWFDAARARYDADPEEWDKKASKFDWTHGLDVGDGGDDHARLSRRGPVLYYATVWHTIGDRKDTIRAAGFMADALRQWPGRGVIDRLGVGAGTLGTCLSDGLMVQGCAFGSTDEMPAKEKKGYENVRAYLYYFKIRREAFELGQIAIAPLGDIEDRLRDELAAIQYETTSKGKIKIEAKKNIIERTGRSPDVADAFALTFAIPTVVKPSSQAIAAGRTGGSRWRH